MTRHLAFNRNHPLVRGDIYFSTKDVRANRLGHMDIVQAEHYSRPALVPVTAGVPGKAQHKPTAVPAERTPGGVELRCRGDSSSYAVYRFEGDGRPGPRAFSDAEHLVATVHGSGGHSTWVDESAPESALDRAFRESPPSTPARVRR